MGALQLLGDARRDQPVPAANESLEPLLRLREPGAQRRPYFGGEAGQPAGIDAVGPGEDAEGAGDGVGLAGIDADDRQAGRGQGRHHEPLVPTAGFQHDAAGAQRLEPSLQPPQAARERGTVQVAPVGSTAMSN